LLSTTVAAAVAAKAVGDVAAISGNVALKQECTLVVAAAAITTTVAAIVIVIVAAAVAGIAGRLGL
jgi:hypothetical protein